MQPFRPQSRTKDDDEDDKDWEPVNVPLVLIRALSYDHLALSNQAENSRGISPMQNTTARKPWYRILYVQVLIAVFVGIVVGWANPNLGKSLKPLGDGFISLVKMIIAPI